MLLENEPVGSVESTFTVSRRPLSFCKVSSWDKHMQTNIALGRCEKLRQRYVVISRNTISTGRALRSRKSWAAILNIFQPVDILARRPYGQSLLLLAPDYRWCFIYSCKINQTAMSVPIFASHHQNKISELKQWLCRMLRCVGKCVFACVWSFQDRMERNTSILKRFVSTPWSSTVDRCCILQVDHFTLVTFAFSIFFLGIQK